jgi:predicted Zn-dependent protease
MFKPDTLDELDRKKKLFCTMCREHLAAQRASD